MMSRLHKFICYALLANILVIGIGSFWLSGKNMFEINYIYDYYAIHLIHKEGNYKTFIDYPSEENYNITDPEYAIFCIPGHSGGFDQFYSLGYALNEFGYNYHLYIFDHDSTPLAFNPQKSIEIASYIAQQIINISASYKKIALVGFSFGGLIAFNTITYPNFPVNKLAQLITISAPLLDHPFKLNSDYNGLYQSIHTFNYSHVNATHVCITAGTPDTSVPYMKSGCNKIHFFKSQLNKQAPSMEGVWNDYFHHQSIFDEWFNKHIAYYITNDINGIISNYGHYDLNAIISSSKVYSNITRHSGFNMKIGKYVGNEFSVESSFDRAVSNYIYQLSESDKQNDILILIAGAKNAQIKLSMQNETISDEVPLLIQAQDPFCFIIAKISHKDLVDYDELLLAIEPLYTYVNIGKDSHYYEFNFESSTVISQNTYISNNLLFLKNLIFASNTDKQSIPINFIHNQTMGMYTN